MDICIVGQIDKMEDRQQDRQITGQIYKMMRDRRIAIQRKRLKVEKFRKIIRGVARYICKGQMRG